MNQIIFNDRDLIVCSVHGDNTKAEPTLGGSTRWTCVTCGATRITF